MGGGCCGELSRTKSNHKAVTNATPIDRLTRSPHPTLQTQGARLFLPFVWVMLLFYVHMGRGYFGRHAAGSFNP